MKIEIDLDDIFRDEEGEPSETMQDAIRRQIIDRLSGDLRKRLFDRLDRDLTQVMQSEMSKVMQAKMPDLIDDIMNSTYTPVSRYGDRSEPTTFRSEIIKAVAANLKYEPKPSSYEENTFTKAVKSIVEAKTDQIKKAIIEQVDVKFKTDAIAFAVKKLSERLGLEK